MGNREMAVVITFGELEIDVSADGVAWSPDVASDMLTRAVVGFSAALKELKDNGMIVQSSTGCGEDDEDDD
jgi:hypothetical protein